MIPFYPSWRACDYAECNELQLVKYQEITLITRHNFELSIIRALRQRPSGEGSEGGPESLPPAAGRARRKAHPIQGLGGDDPETIRSRPDGLSQMRGGG
jgi:hypothetical protein